MPFNLDPVKIFVLLAVALVVLGPERLPTVARTIGSLIRDFQLFRQKMVQEVKEIIPDTAEVVTPITSALNQLPSPSKIIKQELATSFGSSSSNNAANNTQLHETDDCFVVKPVNEVSLIKKSIVVGEGNPIWIPEDPRLN
jgi:Sec-independent protein translocase protein TatA